MKYKQFIIGFLSGALLFGSMSALAENQTIEAYFNNIKILVNGKEVKTDVEPFIMEGRTMVPVRFVAEEFGKEVKFNETTNTVEIDDKQENKPVELGQKEGNEVEIKTPYKVEYIIKDGLGVDVIDGKEYLSPITIRDKYETEEGKLRFVYDWESKIITIKSYDYSKILVESVPTKIINGRELISYEYFESTILPLTK